MMAGWRRIYDIQGVGAAGPHGGNDAGQRERGGMPQDAGCQEGG